MQQRQLSSKIAFGISCELLASVRWPAKLCLLLCWSYMPFPQKLNHCTLFFGAHCLWSSHDYTVENGTIRLKFQTRDPNGTNQKHVMVKMNFWLSLLYRCVCVCYFMWCFSLYFSLSLSLFQYIPLDSFEGQSASGQMLPIVSGGKSIPLTFHNRKAYTEAATLYRLHEMDKQVRICLTGCVIV